MGVKRNFGEPTFSSSVTLGHLLLSGAIGPTGSPGFVGSKGEKGDAGFSIPGRQGFPGIKGQLRKVLI